MKSPLPNAVTAGGLVFLSGCNGKIIENGQVVIKGVAEQTAAALDSIRLTLEGTGSDLNHIVKITFYLTDMDDLNRVLEARNIYYQKYAPELIERPPAETIVGVNRLRDEDMEVEIDVIAAVRA
jgi:2-iminobutanoate/2-iminopropanoate deaminase